MHLQKTLRHLSIWGHVLAVALPLLLVQQQSRAADWKKSLDETLKADYPTTKVGISMMQWDYNRITSPGGLFVVRIDGIYADVAFTKQAIIRTNIVDGHAVQQKGLLAGLVNSHTSRQLKTGESVYITQIKEKDDGVLFELLSENPESVVVAGTTQQTRYRAEVFIPFDRGALPTIAEADIKKAVDPVFATGAVATAVQSKTIQLAQTAEEVKTTLGNPEKVIELGPKTVYVYKDMKIIFVDGKVSDVQ